MDAITWIILALAALAIAVVLAATFFRRATNEVALVRTGLGGRRVVLDGGVLALPYFHEITRVNMQTLRMTVARTGEASLITRDRMRVDVGAEFCASVTPTPAAITRAAQTLGKRLCLPDQLGGLLDGMMIDALRSVAARSTMDELHENRAEFMREVRAALAEPMATYGLQLDAVSLTELDQTPFAALDENNAFNAVGMRKLAEVIARSKKERAEIQSQSEVSVRRAAMEAARTRLEIDLEERRAGIAQGQEVETLLAAQLAEVARRKAEAERAVAEARIAMELAIQSAEIAREQAIREAEIAQARALALAEQDRQISVAEKSQEESRARAGADTARAEATKAAESVLTARALAEGERRKAMALLRAAEEAEAAALRDRAAATSARETAADRAEAERMAAESMKHQRLAEADAARARIDAENTRSEPIVAMELEKARLEALPKIVAEMVRPAEKIKSINIHQIGGLGTAAGGGDRAPVVQAVDQILNMAVQLPALRKIGEAVGLDIEESLTSLSDDKRKT